MIQRCQLHKIRNVEAKLSKTMGATVARKMRAAYHDPDPLRVEATIEALARSLDKAHPGGAGSLREGMAETLTISPLGVSPTLAGTLRSTNAIESMIEICRDHSTNVKPWRVGQMALRWCAADLDRSYIAVHCLGGSPVPSVRRALWAATVMVASQMIIQLHSQRGLQDLGQHPSQQTIGTGQRSHLTVLAGLGHQPISQTLFKARQPQP